MMKVETILGAVIGLFVGAAGGATAGYLVSEKRFMKKVMEIEMARIEVVKPTPEEKKEEVKEEPKKETSPEEEAKKTADDIAAMYKSAIDQAVAEHLKEREEREAHRAIDYSSYSASKPAAKPADPVTERRKMRSADRPYVITEEEFDNTFPEFMKMGNVLYYTESHELVDDEDDTILDVEATVGRENVVNFPDNGVLAVRNEAIATDYLITFVDGSYSYMN